MTMAQVAVSGARLEMCPRCRLHARILCSPGYTSDEFCSTLGGFREVWKGYDMGRITQAEMLQLEEEIESAKLRGNKDDEERFGRCLHGSTIHKDCPQLICPIARALLS